MSVLVVKKWVEVLTQKSKSEARKPYAEAAGHGRRDQGPGGGLPAV